MDDKQTAIRYIISATLCIWSCNGPYSEDYKKAINFVFDAEYTMETIRTALNCCDNGNRRLRIPEFLLAEENSWTIEQFIRSFGDYLAAAAMINGDFTTAEAAFWTQTLHDLSDKCLSQDLDETLMDFTPEDRITPLNQKGYYHAESPSESEVKNDHDQKKNDADNELEQLGAELNKSLADLEKGLNDLANTLQSMENDITSKQQDSNSPERSSTIHDQKKDPSTRSLQSLLEEMDKR